MERLPKFKNYLFRKEIAAGTIDKHIASITNVFNAIGSLQKDRVEDYIYTLFSKDRSPAHLNNMIAAFRHWGDFVEEDFRDIKYFKVSEPEKGIMSDEEITALYSITPDQMEKFLSQKAKQKGGQRKVIRIERELFVKFTFFFFTLSHSGLRPKELVNLRPGQIDFGMRVIRLDSKTKTHTSRTVAISDELYPKLQDYVRKLEGNRIFPDWNRHQWQHQFNMRKEYLGIKREKVTTYSLRHSWVTSLLDNGANLLVVSEMAGWTDINRAKTYYKMTTKSKINAIKKLSLSEVNRPLFERAKEFQEIFFKALWRLAKTPEEQQFLIKSLNLINSPLDKLSQ